MPSSYLAYGTDKKAYPRKNSAGEMREYIVNPYQMAAVSGRYYLIGNYDKYEDVGHYRKAKQVDLVLEDEDGNTLLDTEKKEVLGAVCCQIQNSLDHPKRITTCLAVVEPGRDGLWLATILRSRPYGKLHRDGSLHRLFRLRVQTSGTQSTMVCLINFWRTAQTAFRRSVNDFWK